MKTTWTLVGVALRALAVCCLALACASPSTLSSGSALPLERTHWALESLGPSAAPIAKTQIEAFLSFGEAPGRVSGSGGCNRLAGTYTQTADKLTFGPIAATRMACATGDDIEAAVGSALSSTAAFRIAGDRLELLDAAGATLATFRGRAPG